MCEPRRVAISSFGTASVELRSPQDVFADLLLLVSKRGGPPDNDNGPSSPAPRPTVSQPPLGAAA
jgi:hypothetical protein